ncbi:DUF4837 family protein [bacterium]|nr:DUF4837 family protein [bacterium]
MRRLSIYIFVLTGLTFLSTSCSMKKQSWWQEPVIGVMADTTDWEPLQGDLRMTFERVTRTPQMEKAFEIRYVTKKEFMRYTKARYLVLAATLESTGRVGKIVNRVCSDPAVRKKVESGNNYMFIERDQWSRDQLMVILVSKDIPTLKQKIAANQSFLYDIFASNLKEHLLQIMYKHREQKDLEQRMIVNDGFKIRVQHDYFLAQELTKDGFIWFRRMYPERWIFVRWIDGGDTTMLDPLWVVKERNRIGSKYYGGDSVADKYLFSMRSQFLGRPAQITTGLWENDSKVAGGPFKNYTFYDALSKRIYMIDIAVFAPGEDKMPYLRRLDIIAHTFKTIFEMED